MKERRIMFECAWIARLFGSRIRHGSLRSLGRGRRPRLEVLEDRLSPATLTVNSTADTANATDPYLSLREAIAIVNSRTLPNGLSDEIRGQINGTLHDGNTDSIQFDPNAVTSPILLSQGQLTLGVMDGSTAALTIDGGNGVTVDGNNASRIFQFNRNFQAALSNLTLTHGAANGSFGGALYNNAGTLTVSNVTLTANQSFQGGAIASTGSLTVSNATISSNTSSYGGAIYNSGTATVMGCTLSSNAATSGQGGGIFSDGTLTLENSTVASNSARNAEGGGIYNGGTLTVLSSTLSGGVADTGGGIYNDQGMVTMTNSALAANTASSGGGIENFFATLAVNSSTISGNSVANGSGGGIENSGTLTVTNSTLSGNSAPSGFGGGIENMGTLTVTNSTLSSNLTRNGGGGISNDFGMLTLHNTIVAGNRALFALEINGAVDSSSGYNLIGVGDANLTGIQDGVNNNRIGTTANPINAQLSPLGDHGGPTPTQALLPGSPALDTGDPGQAGNPDQRGVIRSGGVNIGAFQASAAFLVVSAPSSVTAGAAFDVNVSAFDLAGQPAVGYTGTVTLSSTDPQVPTLGSYSFTLADAGSFTFGGVSLLTAGTQTLTAGDTVLSGSIDVTVVAGMDPTPSGGRQAGLPSSPILTTGYRVTGYPDMVIVTDPAILVFSLRHQGDLNPSGDPGRLIF
jgi:predicted outer membrane repeat protein